jgi:hypothetical protein
MTIYMVGILVSLYEFENDFERVILISKVLMHQLLHLLEQKKRRNAKRHDRCSSDSLPSTCKARSVASATIWYIEIQWKEYKPNSID